MSLKKQTKEGNGITEEDAAEDGDPTDPAETEVQENKMNVLAQKHHSKSNG